MNKIILKELGISWDKFGEVFGTNTMCMGKNGETILYKCDVERALWLLGHKLGKYHWWD
jgi:hypothetical protein